MWSLNSGREVKMIKVYGDKQIGEILTL